MTTEFPLPEDEAGRLAALRALRILDTPEDERFDRIVRLALTHFGMPVVRITFVDADRTWFKARAGLNVRQAPRSISVCSHTILSEPALIVPDLAADPRFANSPQVVGPPHFRFYAGAPIVVDGGFRVGAVCLMDYAAHPEFAEVDAAFLRELAQIVVDELKLRQHIDEKEKLIEARTRDLLASERRFRGYAEAAADWFWETDADLRFTYMSENVERIVGVPAAWHYGKTREEMLGPDYDRGVWDAHLRTLWEHRPFRDFVYERVGNGVQNRWLRVNGMPMFDADGTFLGYRGTASDITEQKQAEARLRASEALLHQAQKMEAVGQLTGGVAHDFNNLLAVIVGNADLLDERIGGKDRSINAILRAANRGAELTQRMLAFSRKQPLHPKAIDVGALADGMQDMLARALGETVELTVTAPLGLWPAFADPGLVENALLNLGINARDAMPGGGKVSIVCANADLDDDYVAANRDVQAGDYVEIQVSDEGCGMALEVLAQAFDPFFTTKGVGKGTGLGLSMVYGFAKQSGGHVSLYSEVGRGTTVRLYLPRAAAVDRSTVVAEAATPLKGRGELVLVLEDNPEVRALAVMMLDTLGYRAVEAGDAAEARSALAEAPDVDIVLSDVVLPGGMSGPEFVAEARAARPDLKVVFMSGYPAEVSDGVGLLEAGDPYLSKPFNRRDLAEALARELR